MTKLLSLFQDFFGTDIRFHPIYLLPFLMIAFVLYLREPVKKKREKSFLAWVFPREIYFHPSHIVDLKLFLLGHLLFLVKFFNMVFVQAAFALVGMGLVGLLTGGEMLGHQNITFARVLGATFIITITADFCVYWVHRLHHEAPIIWPFHAVHHSAEVMTPVTVYRKHPVYDVLSDFTKAVLVGLVQGVILMLLMGKIQLSVVAGVNAFYFGFNFLGSNFRHTHIWLSYGRFFEHIFISPAQHQIHHSLEPKHHNKNYGELLAIWDWLFGTLYVPEGQETLSFGISKSSTSSEPIVQPHPTLKAALINPFQESWKAIQRAQNKNKNKGKKK